MKKMIGVVAVVGLILGLFGCVVSQRVRGPNPYKRTYHITCPRNLYLCYNEAGTVCPKGYRILNQGNHNNGTVYLGYGVFGNIRRGEMVIECRR